MSTHSRSSGATATANELFVGGVATLEGHA